VPEASARILRLLLHCGMIAREEQDIVRAMLSRELAGGSLRAEGELALACAQPAALSRAR
jgi:hypothetical protein